MNVLIDAKNLSFKYPSNKEPTLSNISFQLAAGESLGILGPNGGGKTTLMKILSGVLHPNVGELTLFGKIQNSNNQFPHTQISYIPQSTSINLSMPLSANEYLHYAGTSMKIGNLEEKILENAKKVGIDKKLDFRFKDMSGGERQRVLIAKALLNNPQILLLDEPTKGLDSQGQDQLLDVLQKIKDKYLTAVVIVDHNINQVIRHCDKVLCLNNTSHWHEHKDLLTKNILENIYHCEFEHLLIHEKESDSSLDHHHNHQFCDHDHNDSHSAHPHKFIKRLK